MAAKLDKIEDKDDVAFSTPVSIDNDEDVEKAGLYKKQGVPKGVDPAKHERCVMDVKADGKDKSSAYAICNASMNKSEIDTEIEEMAKHMEYSTMDPINEIKKTIAELGPEGLKKALPNMTDENKELLSSVLEEMNKSHKLPLTPPKKLVNVGGENFVEEEVLDSHADEAIFDASVAEGDNEQKHQGGSHDQPYKLDWEGQMIKSLDEFTMEELATFGEIYKAMKMKKMKKDMDEEDMDKAPEKMEKIVTASKNLWGKPPAPRGVGIKSMGDDKSKEDLDKKMKKGEEIEETMPMDDEDMADMDSMAEMEKNMDSMKEKMAMKKEMKKNMYKTMHKNMMKNMYKADSVAEDVKEVEGPAKLNDVLDDAPDDKKDDILRELRESKMKKAKAMMKNAMKKECDMMEEVDDVKIEKMKKDMRKALVSVLSEEWSDSDIAKAKEMMDKEPKLSEFNQVDPEMKDGNAAALNEGKMKLKQEEPADAAKDTADEALAEVKGEMKKSIRYYGAPNDAFKAGRLGRHNYASSVNEYYDAALYKAENPVKKEEEVKKSINLNDINDLIEHGLFKSAVDIETNGRMEEFKKGQGNFTRTSFSEDDMIATCHLSKEDIDKL